MSIGIFNSEDQSLVKLASNSITADETIETLNDIKVSVATDKASVAADKASVTADKADIVSMKSEIANIKTTIDETAQTVSENANSVQQEKIAIDETKTDIDKKYTEISNTATKLNTEYNNLTSNYYTKEATNSLISSTTKPKYSVVNELPTSDISTDIIYLKSTNTTSTDGIYEMYTYQDNNWVKIGTSNPDLADYYTKELADSTFATKTEINNTNTEVSELKGDLANSIPITWIDNTLVRYDNGIQRDNTTNYTSTDYIEIYTTFPIVVKTIMYNDISGLCFYDKNKNYISGFNINDGLSSLPKNTIETLLSIPENAKYIRFSLYKYNGTDTQKDAYIKYSKLTNKILELKENVDINTHDIANIKDVSVNIEESEAEVTKINGNYINLSINISNPIDSYFYTELYELKRGDSISVTSKDPSGGNVARVSKWTADGSKGIEILSYGTTEVTTFKYTATDEIEYLRFSGYISNSMDITLYEVIIPNNLKELISNEVKSVLDEDKTFNHWSYNLWKVLCIGDSLTSGASYAEDWGELAPVGSSIDQNYPRILGRMLNAEVTNAGVSGFSASDWYTKESLKYNFANFDTFIVWLGTNNGLTDTLDTDVNPYTDYYDFANTETGYYCKIIEKIKADNPSCLIVLTKIFASKGNVSTTNTVIDKIAEKYGLPVIDNSDLGYIARPDLHANVANPHFGKAGNIFIANRYVEELGKWFEADHLRSEYGYTSRTN